MRSGLNAALYSAEFIPKSIIGLVPIDTTVLSFKSRVSLQKALMRCTINTSDFRRFHLIIGIVVIGTSGGRSEAKEKSPIEFCIFSDIIII